jgi:hypothetical protein
MIVRLDPSFTSTGGGAGAVALVMAYRLERHDARTK